MRAVIVIIFIVVILPGAVSQTVRLTEQEQRGKRIYLHGTSDAGREITALIGDGTTDVPAATLPCASCHGADGRGRAEGGVIPSDITWPHLTKAYGHQHADGRNHPAFTEAALARAMTMGPDPAGNRLLAAMPKYQMTTDDLNALLAYLKRLGADHDPGVSDETIRIGTILPTAGPQAEIGRAMKDVLAACFAEVNARGGIYQRRLELRVIETTDAAQLRRLIETQEIFALAGSLMPGSEAAIAAQIEQAEVPLIGPFTLQPHSGATVNRQIFYLFSGLTEQVRALVSFAASSKAAPPRAAIVYAETATARQIVAAIEDEYRLKDGARPVQFGFAPDAFEAARLVSRMQNQTSDVYFIGSGAQFAAFVSEAEKLKWQPRFLMPGALAGRDVFNVPPSAAARIFLSWPTLPGDHTRAGLKELTTLLSQHQVSLRHAPTQIAAFCAARLLIEGLQRSGRDLSREKLIAALEKLYEFRTELTPPLSYGPNHRIGALGAYIVTPDTAAKTFIPVGGWISLRRSPAD
ncbi:MAG TPA: ABC transporter substrate-binding protein [Blastocatellia bacterium]|nr:ABC transporter substrate-binding protein [Blastocatellia bacterium]